MINELREICGMLPMKSKVNLFILTFWIIGFGLGGWLYTFGLKRNIKWIKICSVIYFGFGVLGMTLLFVWGTSLLSISIKTAKQQIIYQEKSSENDKNGEKNNKLKDRIKISENSQKTKRENGKTSKELLEKNTTNSVYYEIQHIINKKHDETESNKNFKMFPSSQQEGDFEYLVTNNQVVILRFHRLGEESHVVIPEKIQQMPVVQLGKMSFARIIHKIDKKNPDKMVKVTLPENLEKIEGGAFQMNYNLSEVNLPPKISVIEDFTFAFCGFTNLVLPNTVKKIGKSAFMANWKLNSVAIPSSVEFIGEKAFAGCRNLKTIEILGTNIVIEADAFQHCPKQTTNQQSATNPQ